MLCAILTGGGIAPIRGWPRMEDTGGCTPIGGRPMGGGTPIGGRLGGTKPWGRGGIPPGPGPGPTCGAVGDGGVRVVVGECGGGGG